VCGGNASALKFAVENYQMDGSWDFGELCVRVWGVL
jgi:hypothetical protein